MATPCTACHKDVYGPRTMHSACERAGSTSFVATPAPPATERTPLIVKVIRHETPSGPRYQFICRHGHSHEVRVEAANCSRMPPKAPSARQRPNPPVPAPKVATKAPRGKQGLLGTLRAMGCVQCPTCHHYMAPEHPASCTGDVLMLGYGDLQGFTSHLTSSQQLDNEVRRLAHAIADRHAA